METLNRREEFPVTRLSPVLPVAFSGSIQAQIEAIYSNL